MKVIPDSGSNPENAYTDNKQDFISADSICHILLSQAFKLPHHSSREQVCSSFLEISDKNSLFESEIRKNLKLCAITGCIPIGLIGVFILDRFNLFSIFLIFLLSLLSWLILIAIRRLVCDTPEAPYLSVADSRYEINFSLSLWLLKISFLSFPRDVIW